MAAMAAVFGTATIPLHVEMCTSLLLADVTHLDSASIVSAMKNNATSEITNTSEKTIR
ncbi:hypothetical protein B0A49_02308, partial [Cryomyces minteri]